MPQYPRPDLELEFNQQQLTQPGCCRFVSVVVRLCGVPDHLHVLATVTFERVRKQSKDGALLKGHEFHPSYVTFTGKKFPGYHEYAAELLARGYDDTETGTIRISMTSPSGGVLSEAVYRLMSCQTQPSEVVCKGFRSKRLLEHVRTPQERDALRGQFPPLTAIKGPPPTQHFPPFNDGELQMLPLFPVD